MMHHENTGTLGTILFSAAAGFLTWASDPALWKAIGVAAICGVVGGLGRAVGHWIGLGVERRLKRKQSGKP